jgi:CubicO group peptidase (beta-lactamase class C family)
MEGVASVFVRAHSVPGLSVAVARNGELLYGRGFGFADGDKNERVTPARGHNAADEFTRGADHGHQRQTVVMST